MHGVIWFNCELPFAVDGPSDWMSLHEQSPAVIARLTLAEGITTNDPTKVLRREASDPNVLVVEELENTAYKSRRSASFGPLACGAVALMEGGGERLAEHIVFGGQARRRRRWDFTEADLVFSTKRLSAGGPAAQVDSLLCESLSLLNRFLAVFRCVTGNVFTRTLTMDDVLSGRFWWRLATPSDQVNNTAALKTATQNPVAFRGMTNAPELPIVHLRLSPVYGSPALPNETVQGIVAACVNDVPIPIPIDTLYEATRVLVVEGNNSLTIVLAEVAVEVLLRQIAHREFIREGRTVTEADALLDGPYGGPVKKLGYLGANLRKTGKTRIDEGSTFELWKTHLYEPRKKVIHEGLAPDRSVAKEGLLAAARFIDEIQLAYPPLSPSIHVNSVAAVVGHFLDRFLH